MKLNNIHFINLCYLDYFALIFLTTILIRVALLFGCYYWYYFGDFQWNSVSLCFFLFHFLHKLSFRPNVFFLILFLNLLFWLSYFLWFLLNWFYLLLLFLFNYCYVFLLFVCVFLFILIFFLSYTFIWFNFILIFFLLIVICRGIFFRGKS